MSQTIEPDLSYWDMYLAECHARGFKPDLSDYSVWLQEAEVDRKEYFEREAVDGD